MNAVDIDKSRGIFLNKILSNKHTAPPIFNLEKQSVRCRILKDHFDKQMSNPDNKKDHEKRKLAFIFLIIYLIPIYILTIHYNLVVLSADRWSHYIEE